MADETIGTPAPNTTSGTAHTIPSLPWVIDQDESGAPAALWFKYTAIANQNALGLMVYSNANSSTTYRPKVDIYSGPPGSPFISGQLTPGKVSHTFEIPLVLGITYYIKITNAILTPPSQAGVVLTIGSVLGPLDAYVPGDLVVNDDSSSIYLIDVLNPTDGSPRLLFAGLPASEIGVALVDKGFLFYDNNTLQFSLYDANLNLIIAFADPIGTHTPSVTGDYATKFYFAEWGGGGITTKTVNPDTGAVAASRTLTGFVQQRIAISPDESKMYYDQTTAGVIAIAVWDMVGNAALPTLATINEGDGTDFLIDMHVMSDGSIVAMNKHHAFRYNAGGTLLNTYVINAGPHRLTLDRDPAYFWVWTEPPGTQGNFQKIRAADGVVAVDFNVDLFESGNGTSSDSLSRQRFGPSGTCALVIALSSSTPPPTFLDSHTLVYATGLMEGRSGWFADRYTPAILTHYGEEGENIHAILCGGVDGGLYQLTGDSDNNQDINCEIRTMSRDQSDTRFNKLYGDIMLDCDTQGVNVIATAKFNNETIAAPINTIVEPSRTQVPVTVGTQWVTARNIMLDLQWAFNGPRQHFFTWEPRFTEEGGKVYAFSWETCWLTHELHGYFFHGYLYCVHISNADLLFEIINPDNTAAASVVITGSGNEHHKDFIRLPVVKGKIYKYRISSLAEFRIEGQESELLVKAWGATDAWRRERIFRDVPSGEAA